MDGALCEFHAVLLILIRFRPILSSFAILNVRPAEVSFQSKEPRALFHVLADLQADGGRRVCAF